MDYSNMKFCQSCGMPLMNEEDKGTEKDGSRSEYYCKYCYADGAFSGEMTMDQMIEFCVPMVSKGNPYPDEAAARAAMQELFPKLKRWQKA